MIGFLSSHARARVRFAPHLSASLFDSLACWESCLMLVMLAQCPPRNGCPRRKQHALHIMVRGGGSPSVLFPADSPCHCMDKGSTLAWQCCSWRLTRVPQDFGDLFSVSSHAHLLTQETL